MVDFVADSEREQLYKDFQSIVGAPGNHMGEYQRAAEKLSERTESALGLAAQMEIASQQSSRDYTIRLFETKVVPDSPRNRVWHQQIRTIGTAVPVSGPYVQIVDETARRPSRIGYSLFYRICWVLLAIAMMAWGGVIGASLAGAALVGLTTGMAGTIGLTGLAFTLAVAGRRTRTQRVE